MSGARGGHLVTTRLGLSEGVVLMGLFSRRPSVPVIRMSGTIGMATPLRPGITMEAVAPVIAKAFSASKLPAVAILINSPGGSPVQSTLIYKRIRALAEEKKKRVYVFAEDVMASGGYMLALAGDEIYADPSSIVGSIGVISAGFGFDKLIERVGVERRVYTAGLHKMSLDPFQPEKPDEIERLKSIQREVHETFIAMVKERRASRLTAPHEELFNGDVWTGGKASALGIVDGVGDVRAKMRELFGPKVKLKLISPPRSWFSRGGRGVSRLIGSVSPGVGAPNALGPYSFADDVISALEARALWSRYGL